MWLETEAALPLLTEPERLSGERVGRFVILDLLGRGATGAVFRAYDPDLNRHIALKLLTVRASTGTVDAQAYSRLLREAQALACFSHPNIVGIYDVGVYQEHVFLAMELIEGQTLAQWLAAGRRSIPEVLEMMTAAGRGLRAAHDAGLVHRDFKPQNVLIGNDGRVRVIDFGLARAVAQADLNFSKSRNADALSESLLDSPLTQMGSVVGTPAYMAPEQLVGEEVTAESDQFSYCVVLFEALIGELPFTGDSVEALREQRSAGPPPFPSEPTVPDWLRRLVQRGLETQPEARFPSMHHLLDLLESTPLRRRRRRALGLGALAVAMLFTGVVGVTQLRTSRCVPEPGPLANTLASNAESLNAALTKSFPKRAVNLLTQVHTRIDTFERAWRQGYQRACEATFGGEQNRTTWALRKECFDRALSRAQGIVVALSEQTTTTDPLAALDKLASPWVLKKCDDVSPLTTNTPPESLRKSVARLQHQLDGVQTLEELGHFTTAINTINAMLETNEAQSYGPLHAQMLYRRASLLNQVADFDTAAAVFHEAAEVAAASNEPLTIAQVMRELTAVVGVQLARHGEGLAFGRASRLALLLANDPPTERALLEQAIGQVQQAQGDYATAKEHFASALAFLEGDGVDDARLGETLNSQGLLHTEIGELVEGRRFFERALQHFEAIYDPLHPEIGRVLNNIGLVEYYADNHAEALGFYKQALAILVSALGPLHPEVASLHNNLAVTYQSDGRYAVSLEHHEKALAIREEALAPNHPNLALSHANVGVLNISLENYDAAEMHLRSALSMYESSVGEDHQLTTHAYRYLGRLYRKKGECERALHYLEAALNSDSPGAWQTRALARADRGRCYTGAGRIKLAIEDLENALATLESHGLPDSATAATRFALAQALWHVEGRRAEAQKHAQQARAAFIVDARPVNRSRLVAFDRWLKQR